MQFEDGGVSIGLGPEQNTLPPHLPPQDDKLVNFIGAAFTAHTAKVGAVLAASGSLGGKPSRGTGSRSSGGVTGHQPLSAIGVALPNGDRHVDVVARITRWPNHFEGRDWSK
jgi:hypothetical protein